MRHLYNMFLVGVFSYAIFILDRSGWWFAFMILIGSHRPKTDWEKEHDND